METEEDPSFARIRSEYPAVLTSGQVAELLDLNPRTVLNMAADGRLPASRLPGSRKIHFFLEDILQALREHMITPGSAADGESDEEPASVGASKAPPRRATKKAAKRSGAGGQRGSAGDRQRRRG